MNAPVSSSSPWPARLDRWLSRPLLWLVLVLLVGAFPATQALRSAWAQPPVLGALPAFALLDQQGRPWGSEQLRGRVWVANFIFTRCPTVCPAFTAKMASLQRSSEGWPARLTSVSFSVDPDYDTPEKLRAYAAKYGADPRWWYFLTGDFDHLQATVVQGLKVAMGNNDPDGDVSGIFHGSHFVLVDADLRIRGYYDSVDADVLPRVLKDAQKLLRQAPGAV